MINRARMGAMCGKTMIGGRVALSFGRHVRGLGSAYICRQLGKMAHLQFALMRCRQLRVAVPGPLDDDAAGARERGRRSENGVC